jgi:hypothetical protein
MGCASAAVDTERSENVRWSSLSPDFSRAVEGFSVSCFIYVMAGENRGSHTEGNSGIDSRLSRI